MRTRRLKIIRRVTKLDRYGRPKVARDSKTGFTVERVRAQGPRPCHKRGCAEGTWPGMIREEDQYAKVTDQMTGIRAAGRFYPKTTDFHWGCVPKGASRLVRFFANDLKV